MLGPCWSWEALLAPLSCPCGSCSWFWALKSKVLSSQGSSLWPWPWAWHPCWRAGARGWDQEAANLHQPLLRGLPSVHKLSSRGHLPAPGPHPVAGLSDTSGSLSLLLGPRWG